jgi:hypothetical protein
VNDERGLSLLDLEAVESTALSETGEMLGVVGVSPWTAVWEEKICAGPVDVRVGDAFRNLQTNRTFLNTFNS